MANLTFQSSSTERFWRYVIYHHNVGFSINHRQFRDELLQKGFQGGVAAARQLRHEVVKHVKDSLPDLTEIDIFVRVFLNMVALQKYAIGTNKKEDLSQITAFLEGFAKDNAFVDLVHVNSQADANAKVFCESPPVRYWRLPSNHCSQLR